MISQNGVVRIGRKGIINFAFGDDGAPFALDVIRAYDEWAQIDQSFRDESGKIVKDQIVAWSGARASFVQQIVEQAGQAINLSGAEVNDFMARLEEEVMKLRAFFEPRTPEKPSSPESTELRFSM